MSENRKELREARRVINTLTRVCRQTQTYFSGISVMDRQKVQRILRDAVRESDRFTNNF